MTERPRLPALTSVRFCAALHVCVFHMYAMKIVSGGGVFHRIASIGYVGVNFFFVLSGFILVYTYADRGTSAREFWWARFARIYPAYLFSLLMAGPFFFYVCLKMHPAPIPFLIWPQNHLITSCLLVLPLVQSWVPGAALAWNAPAWSLSDEAFFYLLFPVLLVWLAKKSQRTWLYIALACGIASLACTVGYAAIRPDGAAFVDDNSYFTWLNVIKFFPLIRLPEFILGACCGFLFLRRSIECKWATPLVLIGLAYFAMIVAAAPRIPYPILHDSALTPGFALIIFGLALRPAWSRFLEFWPLVLLGDASYSFYLLHSNLIGMVFQPTGEPLHLPLWKLIAGLMVPIAVSIVVYRWIESTARRKLLGKKKRKLEVAPAAAATA
jgi:peptidoglycan/LPS O-acetylase OafA/YrhL